MKNNWLLRNWKWIFALLIGVYLLSRVSVHRGYLEDDKIEAAKLIEQFHARMNAGSFEQIYDDAHPDFQRSTSRGAWIERMTETQRQYGAFASSKTLTMNVVIAAPVQIRAVYESKFEKADAIELFIFLREAKSVRLLTYGIRRTGGL
jgi:hypothetical protein